MAALLRSGKFLRVVTGFARQQQQPLPNGQQQQQNGPGSKAGGPDQSGYHPSNYWDSSSPFQAWSLQHMQSALPVLASANGQDRFEQDEEGNFWSGIHHQVTVQEIESLLERIPHLDPKLALAQSVLVLRLCGNVLAQNVADGAIRTDFVHKVFTCLEEEMGVDMNVNHYNALLAVYKENKHDFCPDFVQNRMKKKSILASKETYEAFLERYCLDGNMEGANQTFKVMQEHGYSISRSSFQSMVQGYTSAGDLKSALQILQSMRFYDLKPDSSDFLAALHGCTAKGDLSDIQTLIHEADMHKSSISTSDLFDLMNKLCDNKHKEASSKMLKLIQKREAEDYEGEAKSALKKMVASGHDDVAFEILQTSLKPEVAKEFLEVLVQEKRPVTKLLWFTEEMNRLNMLKGGFEIILQKALDEDNFSLSLKLAEIYVQDGHEIAIDNLPKALLDLCSSSLDVLSTVKAIKCKLSQDELRNYVIPKIESFCSKRGNVDELVENLSKTGLEKSMFIKPLVDFLIRTEQFNSAQDVAMANKKFLNESDLKNLALPVPNDQLKKMNGEEKLAEPAEDFTASPLQMYTSNTPKAFTAVALVQVFDPATQSFQYCPLPTVCETFRMQGRFWELEQLLVTSQGSYTQEDRKAIFLYTLQCYVDQGLYDKAILLTSQLEVEGLAFNFPQYHFLMRQFAESLSTSVIPPSRVQSTLPPPSSRALSEMSSSSYPPTPASEAEEQIQLQSHYHKALKRALGDKDSDAAFKAYVELTKTGKNLNVTEASSLIELLVKGDYVREGAALAQEMLRKETYPMPKIFRFLLNKLAAHGEVEAMNEIGLYLSPKVKKEVSFDNRLCNAYLSADRASEFLDLLSNDLAHANTESLLQSVKDKFPRGGAMGLLENNPNLIAKYSDLAFRFVELDYVAPMNVLWTYYFINNDHEKAAPLWEKYVKNCPQIMFQKICQTARSKKNLDLASRLVALLQDAKVTSGAQGIAYSCLLDVLTQHGDYRSALIELNRGLCNGVRMDDVNRTAIVRLKSGLEKEGFEFPYEVPKKSLNKDTRCVSPSSEEC